MDDSEEIIKLFLIKGKNLINLNSNPHQINNQLFEHKLIITPTVIIVKKNILEEFIFIKKEKILLL